MGLFGIDSTSSTAEDKRVAATDQAQVAQQGNALSSAAQQVFNGGTVANPGSLALGYNSKLGTIEVTNARDVTLGDTQAVQQLASQFNQTLGNALGAEAQNNAQAQQQTSSILSDLANKLSAAGQDQKTYLYLALGALLIVAVILIWRK